MAVYLSAALKIIRKITTILSNPPLDNNGARWDNRHRRHTGDDAGVPPCFLSSFNNEDEPFSSGVSVEAPRAPVWEVRDDERTTSRRAGRCGAIKARVTTFPGSGAEGKHVS